MRKTSQYRMLMHLYFFQHSYVHICKCLLYEASTISGILINLSGDVNGKCEKP